ncbi:hypothetical protein PWY87_34045 [Kribbella solani]|uniref:hypothetical protein n=1 Tax=Kribbella solani TaxID=236067 RepID=UPI0029B9C17B|nr:hypothetical protein [Kribbella solani]MDX3006739.1 hypothetical protein [Kribbella solani]
MAVRTLETSPDVEFEFFLATKLGKTVGQIRQMPNEEFVMWDAYYARVAQQQELARLEAQAGGKG